MYRYPTNILLFDVIDSSGVIARDRGATKASRRGVSHKVGLFKRKISDWEIDLQQIIESYSNCAAGHIQYSIPSTSTITQASRNARMLPLN